ncbi:hypothetical protein ACFFRR_003203 [Megaselia abdita]
MKFRMMNYALLAVLLSLLTSTQALNCVQCNSKYNSDCVANVDNVPAGNTCHDNSVCFYRVDIEDGTLERGCLPFDKLTDCMDDHCSFCNYEDNCNKGVYPRDRLQCVVCEDCHDNSTLPTPQICDSYKVDDLCFTYTDPKTNKTSRGCDSQGIPVCADCLYNTCKGAGCNTDVPVISSFTCHECLGDEGDCISGLDTLETVRCTHGNRCVARYNSETKNVERRCVASDKEVCDKTEEAQGTCKICEDENCNKGVFPNDRLSCLQCESEQKDDNCYNGTVAAAHCSSYDRFDRCYSFIDHNDVFHRGCESSGYCKGTDRCYMCGVNGCNTHNKTDEPKPSNFECYKCLGADAVCLLGTSPTEACQNGNQCIMKVTDDKKIERRCVLNEEETCKANTTCVTCTEDRCNGGVFPKDKVELFYMVMIKV